MSEEYIKIEKSIIGGALEGTVDKLYKVHGPFWDSRLDITKSVLTLTSAILIGTITFSNFLIHDNQKVLVEILFLKSSWVFFFESIFCGLVSLWFIYDLNSLSPRLFYRQWQINEIIDLLDSSQEKDKLKADIDHISKRFINASIKPIIDSDNRSHIALKAQLFSFGCGLLAFLAFGSYAIV